MAGKKLNKKSTKSAKFKELTESENVITVVSEPVVQEDTESMQESSDELPKEESELISGNEDSSHVQSEEVPEVNANDFFETIKPELDAEPEIFEPGIGEPELSLIHEEPDTTTNPDDVKKETKDANKLTYRDFIRRKRNKMLSRDRFDRTM